MRLRIALFALAIGLTAPASAEAATNQGRCAKKGSRTVLSGRQARVYRTPGVLARLHGCLYRTGRSFYLGGDDCKAPQGKLTYLRLAGTHVAYLTTSCPPPGEVTFTSVAVASLRKGRRREFGPYLARSPPSYPCFPYEPCSLGAGFNDVTALELKPNGSIAWIGRRRGRYRPTSPFEEVPYTLYEVRKAERFGDSVLLDSGADIDPGSLRLGKGRTTVSWTRGGVESSAPLR